MSMTLIKGEFKIVNSSPDGDSVKFYPYNPDLWQQLNRKIHLNAYGACQLRLEAIDALETHYQPENSYSKPLHQPKILAHASATELLKFIGFTEIERNLKQTVIFSVPEAIPGFILTRFVDRYGRAIAFVFKGESPDQDGSEVYLTRSLLQDSANYHLLSQGLVYPTFYSKIYIDIRLEMLKAVQTARESNLGLWQLDQTTRGFTFVNWQTITEDVVILPRLFRRLVSYAVTNRTFSLVGFKDYLAKQYDPLTVYPENEIRNLEQIAVVEGQNLRLITPVEMLVFQEK